MLGILNKFTTSVQNMFLYKSWKYIYAKMFSVHLLIHVSSIYEDFYLNSGLYLLNLQAIESELSHHYYS